MFYFLCVRNNCYYLWLCSLILRRMSVHNHIYIYLNFSFFTENNKFCPDFSRLTLEGQTGLKMIKAGGNSAHEQHKGTRSQLLEGIPGGRHGMKANTESCDKCCMDCPCSPCKCCMDFWFGTKRTRPFVFQINWKMVNTIWFRFDLIRFRKYFSVCTSVAATNVASCEWTFHTQIFSQFSSNTNKISIAIEKKIYNFFDLCVHLFWI